MRDYYIIFGLILAFFAVGFFIAWRMEVRERRELQDR